MTVAGDTGRMAQRAAPWLGALWLAGCFDLSFQVGDDASTSTAATTATAGPATGSSSGSSSGGGATASGQASVVSTGDGAGTAGTGGSGADEGGGGPGGGGRGTAGGGGIGGGGGTDMGTSTAGPATIAASSSTGNPGMPNGEPCVLSQDCQSGRCVDDVCCDTTCHLPCQACTAAKKGEGDDGVCGPIVFGDPDLDCVDTCGECEDGSCVEMCIGAFTCCTTMDPPQCTDPGTCI